ncbi:biotin/acetyl-CoA-carboxylase ligase [Methanothermus fervidus DSM 2088]|uniref:Biotin/acetyl-CoA-carboxylase ligase n=1 Tax=Methanothermus fervidus (strain ATCC 43054 / DSM 2088 / JCM 10308 / V24 S) TaxID=523846 RepID=E3GX29_METFV|nr:biotin--[acetyl-CoA-carboxylase] ligase [Methanothermus fervidus]ADP76918.1 biotin/acetyl-CoA-carboxylase ligase [Methanothermus fervidus DSM 2088]
MKEKVLNFLYEKKEVSKKDIVSELGIDEKEFDKIIEKLKNYLKIHKDKYKLKNSHNLLLPSLIKSKLKTNYIGRNIYYFDIVDSTNLTAKKLAEKGEEEGTIVLAQVQTRGRGRENKEWISPKGGIWTSIILKPDIPAVNAPQITLMTAVAVAKTLKKLFKNLDVGIKWPNDVLIGNKKVCGILTESYSRNESLEYVIVGVGIDINVDINSFPIELQEGATSIKEELGKEVPLVDVLCEFLYEFEKVYEKFKAGKFQEILKEWRALSKTIGSYVEIRKKFGKRIRGEAVGVTKDGALILELDDGRLKKIFSGACIHLS